MKILYTLLFTAAIQTAFSQPVDSALVRQVDSLVLVSRSLTGQRNYDKAIELNDVAEKMALEKLGKNNPTYGNCLFNRGRVFHLKGDLEQGEKFYLEAIKVQEKAPGADPKDLANSLNNLGIIYRRQERYPEAEPIYLRVKEIREKIFTKKHPEYAGVLVNLGSLYTAMSRFGDAEKCLTEAKNLWDNDLPMDSARYANVLDNLGDVFFLSGRYEEAEPLYLQVKNIRGKILGVHPEYARILNELANLYSESSRLEAAERLYKECMGIQEKLLGKESPDHATSLNNLGDLYRQMGRFEEAERALLEAKSTWEKIAGTESREYAVSLDNLASLYYKLGVFDLAEPLFKAALDTRKKLDEKSADYSSSLNNLAVLYMAKQDFKAAEPLFKSSGDILQNLLGKEHDSYAWGLNNLGILYEKTGRLARADSLLSAAKTIREKALGKEHPGYANTLEDLAVLYQKMNKPEAALKLHLEAKTIFEKALGKTHPRYVECIGNLAVLYQKQGKHAPARQLFAEANALRRRQLVSAARHLSERELESNAALFTDDLDRLYSITYKTAPDAELLGSLYDNTLFYKGFLLSAAHEVRLSALRDTASAETFELLAACQRRLSELYTKPVSEQAGVAVLEEKANRYEKELVRRSAAFGQAIRQVAWKEVMEQLKPGEAAVEFIRYRYLVPDETDSVMYSALVLLPGEAAPRLVYLCEEKSLDSLFGATARRNAEYANALYSYEERGAMPLDKPRKSLYEMVWQPLEEALKGAATVYFSPSGLLHRVNLAAIPVDEETKLIDNYNLVELISTRKLVVPDQVKTGNQEILLLGGVKYDLDSLTLQELTTESMLASRSQESKLDFNPGRTAAGVTSWRKLSHTIKEVISIRSMAESAGMKPLFVSETDASEAFFKSLSASLKGDRKKSPRFLHLATHGFFFTDPAGMGNPDAGVRKSETVFQISAHPMIRSGLILSGGNFAWQNGKAALPGLEDGILTAYEISQMDLSDTELVVLSACETGLGDIRGNEGVYGLQRAFKIAGAKYVIMSLWEVPDDLTKKLMAEYFYPNLLKNKMPIREAFYAAQKTMREIGFAPHQWAGFVLIE